MLRDIYKESKYAISKVIIFDCSLKNMSDVGNYEKYNVFIRKKDKVSSTLSGGGGGYQEFLTLLQVLGRTATRVGPRTCSEAIEGFLHPAQFL